MLGDLNKSRYAMPRPLLRAPIGLFDKSGFVQIGIMFLVIIKYWELIVYQFYVGKHTPVFSRLTGIYS